MYQALWDQSLPPPDVTPLDQRTHSSLNVASSVSGKTWGLLGPLENPSLDSRKAMVLWSPDDYSEVLLVAATPTTPHDEGFPGIDALQCQTVIHLHEAGRQHVLFAQEGRCLQLEVSGASLKTSVKLAAEVTPARGSTAHHFKAIERLRDLQAHLALRPHLYAAHKGAARLVEVLQILDGLRVTTSHRDLAVALFGPRRVAEEWTGQNRHMRDKVRKTVRRALNLVNGGYRNLLR
jgi:hypothetical protein